MNSVNTSTSNFRMQTVIALALTAATTTGFNAENIALPYYVVPDVSQFDMKSSTTTVSNIGNYNQYKISDVEQYELVRTLGEHLVRRSQDIDSQIAKIVDDNFWDLI